MKKRKCICWLIFSILVSTFSINGRLPVNAGSIFHYESAGTSYEYYDSKDNANKAYYQSFCSPAALDKELPKLPNSISYYPPVNSGGHPLNYRIWVQKGLVVYGTPQRVPNNRFKCGYQVHIPGNPTPTEYYGDGYFISTLSQDECDIHGTICPTRSNGKVRGEWQYLGFDASNNKFSNISFINDANVTTFSGRKWIEQPWEEVNKLKTGLSSMSLYNQAVYWGNIDSPKVREWIDNTLKGWSPDGSAAVPYITDFDDVGKSNKVQYDPEVYQYLYVQSPPTLMRSGQGRMWHQRPSSVWYQSLSIPKQETKLNSDVTATVAYDFPELPDNPELPADDDATIKYVDVTVTSTLHDEDVFTGTADEQTAKKTVYYHRGDVATWEYKITVLNNEIAKTGVQANQKVNYQTYTFKGKGGTTTQIPVSYAQYKSGFSITAQAQPVYINGKKGNPGHASVTAKAGILPPPPPPPGREEPIPVLDDIKVFIPTLMVGNDIPEVAFDNIPFVGATDNTDMTLVTDKELYIDGVQADYDTFFSGEYIFPRTTGRNGYLTQVEVIYRLDKDAIIAEGLTPEVKARIESMAVLEYKSTDVVYVYPTKPYAHFSLSSNSWKQNRIIDVKNDSTGANIQMVVEKYPIVQYRWSYGGDTGTFYKGTDTDLQKQLQYKNPGTYRITLEAMNTLNQWSDPYQCEFTVLEDYAPNIECNLSDSVITRTDTLKAWHYDIASTDGDRVKASRIELWYDTDNNGTLDTRLQTWDGLGGNGICEIEDFPSYTPSKLGYYAYRIFVDEEFIDVPGQDSLTQYLSAADRKTAYYEVEWWVDNYQPLADIYVNAPVERPDVDILVMLDKNLNASKNETIINERVTMENFLLGQNIIPDISVWDLKTYTYSQSVSTNYNSGSSFPPASISHSSNGYSGTLSRQSYWDNGSYTDYGHYSSQTETKSVSDSASQSGSFCSACVPGGVSPSYSTTDGKSYSDSQGFSGYMTLSYSYSGYTDMSATCPIHPSNHIYHFSRSWYWSGTASRTVQVWVPDLRWNSNYWGSYSGTIYKDVKQPYTDPYRADSYKYILYVSDSNIADMADFNTAKSKADAKVILAGLPGIKSQTAFDRFIDVSAKSINDVISEALNYVAESSPDVEKITILQGQVFNLQMAEYDLEGDSIVQEQLQYVHEPDYFDNPTGQEPGTATEFKEDDKWVTNVKDRLLNVGRYRIYRRVKDQPAGSIGSSFSYYSGATEVNIYVHRKPIADAILDWEYNPISGACETLWIDQSYDLDHNVTMVNKGIVDRKIMFRRNGGEWLYYIPSTLTYGTTYEVRYYVQDVEGVWSDPWLKTFTLDGQPQFSAQGRAKDSAFSLASIPASEYLEGYNMWTRQPNPMRLEMALTPSVSGLPATKIISFQPGVTGNQSGQDVDWFNQELQIPAIFPDGLRTFTISARDTTTGLATSTTFSVNVFTPINLVPTLQGKTLNTGVSSTITAGTSKYPSSTTVVMQRGTPYQSAALSMTGALSGNAKNWALNYTVPAGVLDGTYTARFTSTNPSGKTEYRDVTYTVVRNRPPTLSIMGTVPSFVYEGDDISVIFQAADPDLDTLTCDVRIKKGPATVWTGSVQASPASGGYMPLTLPSVDDIGEGSYIIEITATDPYNEKAQANYGFVVSPLGIEGRVGHTQAWEENRLKYNNAAIAAGREIHQPDVFFAGEKYILHADTTLIDPHSTVIADYVRVYIQGTGFWTQLNKTSSNTFDGELWNEAMMKWKGRTVDFLFEVHYSNGTVKTDIVRTYTSQDDYWQLHLEF